MSRTAVQVSPRLEWSLDNVQHFYLDFVSWELYEHFLKELGDRRLKITFDNGELEMMSPLWEHEEPSRLIGHFVFILAEEMDIPLRGGGSTTLRRKSKKKGLEPDECFYIKNHALIKGKKRISLPKDPPPDLAIEIDITSWSIPRLPIYAALGVPEIWRYDGKRLQCLHLGKDAKYHEVEKSLSFPMLKPAELTRFIKLAESSDQIKAAHAFRKWVRKQG
jgi:Uma2 family endonuclease